jgi:hypothetical protein
MNSVSQHRKDDLQMRNATIEFKSYENKRAEVYFFSESTRAGSLASNEN